MKPPPFEYARPASVEDALRLLERPGAKLLAGGQSLIPLLNLRLARPELLVDVGRLASLDFIESDLAGNLRLGGLVRHQRLLLDETVARNAPLLRLAVEHVGHVAIRNRGTLGGSLAHADPAAELPLAMVALAARFRLQSRAGERWLDAETFFEGPFGTAAREDEFLTEVLVSRRPDGERAAFLEVSPRRGDFALVAVAAVASSEGTRVAWSGAAGRPMLVPADVGSVLGALLPADSYKRAALEELTERALREVAG